MQKPSQFLTATWKNLALLNYVVDPDLLKPYVPAGTELDLWDGQAYISLVGFQFHDVRLRGWRIPFHRHFDEVNLRFYVRRWYAGQWRRGVTFIKEIAPRWAVVFVARWIYNEQYVTLPLTSAIQVPQPDNEFHGHVRYAWKWSGRWNAMEASPSGTAVALRPGTPEEFILEHYWGYSRQRDGSTMEYEVEHPAWRIWTTDRASFTGDVSTLYGAEFGRVLQTPPAFAVVAEGSPIVVRRGLRVRSEPFIAGDTRWRVPEEGRGQHAVRG